MIIEQTFDRRELMVLDTDQDEVALSAEQWACFDPALLVDDAQAPPDPGVDPAQWLPPALTDAAPGFADWADVGPGAGLTAALEDAFAHLASLDQGSLVDAVGAARRSGARMQAMEMVFAARFFAAATAAAIADDPELGSFGPAWQAHCRAVQGELALALHVTEGTVGHLIGLGQDLTGVFPQTLTMLLAGELDVAKAQVIVNGTAILGEPELRRRVQDRVLPHAAAWTSHQLRRAVDREVLNIDPQAAERRRKQAERNARLYVRNNPESGTANLSLARSAGHRRVGLPGPRACAGPRAEEPGSTLAALAAGRTGADPRPPPRRTHLPVQSESVNKCPRER